VFVLLVCLSLLCVWFPILCFEFALVLSSGIQLRVVMPVAMYRIKTMFGWTLHPVVCRLIRVLFELFVFVYV